MISLIENTEGIYEGNLRHYFKIIFNAPNVHNPYHNFRHMCHVTWQIFDAIKYYQFTDKSRSRALLIAGLFHDYGHNGIMGNDSINIKASLAAVTQFILPEDKNLLPEIEGLISVTEFPHKTCDPTRAAKIIRDADMSQVFSEAWIQMILFGLSREYNISPLTMLEKELEFLPSVVFETDWAKNKFEPLLKQRIEEVKKFIEILK